MKENQLTPETKKKWLKIRDRGVDSQTMREFYNEVEQFMADVLAAEREKVDEIMQNIIENDKTPRYRYGGSKNKRMNVNGELPSEGRWLTPAEIATDYLSPPKGSK